jgi:hypothetical protein
MEVYKVQELELQSHIANKKGNIVTDNCVVTSMERCDEGEDWVTPDCILSSKSDCNIVGNKIKSLFTDESQHSKWKEFRQTARIETANEECSQLLRRMELEDSEDDGDEIMADIISKEEIEKEATQIEENLGRKKQKNISSGGLSRG